MDGKCELYQTRQVSGNKNLRCLWRQGSCRRRFSSSEPIGRPFLLLLSFPRFQMNLFPSELLTIPEVLVQILHLHGLLINVFSSLLLQIKCWPAELSGPCGLSFTPLCPLPVTHFTNREWVDREVQQPVHSVSAKVHNLWVTNASHTEGKRGDSQAPYRMGGGAQPAGGSVAALLEPQFLLSLHRFVLACWRVWTMSLKCFVGSSGKSEITSFPSSCFTFTDSAEDKKINCPPWCYKWNGWISGWGEV